MKKIILLSLVCAMGAMGAENHRQLTVSGTPKLDLSNVSGQVEISQGETGIVEVSWVRHDNNVKVEVEQKGNRIYVQVDYPKKYRNKGGVDFTVLFPEQGDLEIQSVSGDIKVDGISGELEIGTVSGNLDVTHSSGELELSTVSGNLTVASLVDAKLEAASVSGNVNYEGNFEGGEHEFSSTSGNLFLTVTEGASFEVEGSSLSGNMKIDIDGLEIEKEKYTGFKQLSGSVGSGRSKVELSTISGQIKIQSR